MTVLLLQKNVKEKISIHFAYINVLYIHMRKGGGRIEAINGVQRGKWLREKDKEQNKQQGWERDEVNEEEPASGRVDGCCQSAIGFSIWWISPPGSSIETPSPPLSTVQIIAGLHRLLHWLAGGWWLLESCGGHWWNVRWRQRKSFIGHITWNGFRRWEASPSGYSALLVGLPTHLSSSKIYVKILKELGIYIFFWRRIYPIATYCKMLMCCFFPPTKSKVYPAFNFVASKYSWHLRRYRINFWEEEACHFWEICHL